MTSVQSDSATDSNLDRRIARLVESHPEDIADPFPLYHKLLEYSPIHPWGPTMVVSRLGDVQAISRDSVTFSNRAYSVGSRAQAIYEQLSQDERRVFEEVSAFEAMYVSRADGDQHSRLRGIAHRAFTPRKMAQLDELVEQYTNELLDDMQRSGQQDFVAGLSSRLPFIMIALLLDVPLGDIDLIRGWTALIGKNRGGQVTADLLAAHAALGEFRAYVSELVTRHGAEPTTELVSTLMTAARAGELTTDELLATMVVLIFAGTDTTTALLGNGLLALLQNRSEWEQLVSDPDGNVVTATEELARYVTPVQTTWRVTTAATELGSVPLEKGQTILVLLGAANRDPRAFEDPDRLDIARTPNRHIGFWFGSHFCLGAALARLEAHTVFKTLAARFPGIKLADASPPAWRGNIQFRTVAELNVEFGPEAG